MAKCFLIHNSYTKQAKFSVASIHRCLWAWV